MDDTGRRAKARACRGLPGSAILLSAALLSNCAVEPEAQVSTRVEALLPRLASAAPAKPAEGPCELVEREARKLGASMPRALDEHTRVTAVTARGCALTLEYQILDLKAADVAPMGVAAMRERVVGQLCADAAALATLQRGGSFTNIYYDEARARIGEFTVAHADCATPRPLERP